MHSIISITMFLIFGGVIGLTEAGSTAEKIANTQELLIPPQALSAIYIKYNVGGDIKRVVVCSACLISHTDTTQSFIAPAHCVDHHLKHTVKLGAEGTLHIALGMLDVSDATLETVEMGSNFSHAEITGNDITFAPMSTDEENKYQFPGDVCIITIKQAKPDWLIPIKLNLVQHIPDSSINGVGFYSWGSSNCFGTGDNKRHWVEASVKDCPDYYNALPNEQYCATFADNDVDKKPKLTIGDWGGVYAQTIDQKHFVMFGMQSHPIKADPFRHGCTCAEPQIMVHLKKYKSFIENYANGSVVTNEKYYGEEF